MGQGYHYPMYPPGTSRNTQALSMVCKGMPLRHVNGAKALPRVMVCRYNNIFICYLTLLPGRLNIPAS